MEGLVLFVERMLGSLRGVRCWPQTSTLLLISDLLALLNSRLYAETSFLADHQNKSKAASEIVSTIFGQRHFTSHFGPSIHPTLPKPRNVIGAGTNSISPSDQHRRE